MLGLVFHCLVFGIGYKTEKRPIVFSVLTEALITKFFLVLINYIILNFSFNRLETITLC